MNYLMFEFCYGIGWRCIEYFRLRIDPDLSPFQNYICFPFPIKFPILITFYLNITLL